jgi:hypothetical protein
MEILLSPFASIKSSSLPGRNLPVRCRALPDWDPSKNVVAVLLVPVSPTLVSCSVFCCRYWVGVCLYELCPIASVALCFCLLRL